MLSTLEVESEAPIRLWQRDYDYHTQSAKKRNSV